VLVHDLLEEGPPVLAADPLDQAAQVMGWAHALGSLPPLPSVLGSMIPSPDPSGQGGDQRGREIGFISGPPLVTQSRACYL